MPLIPIQSMPAAEHGVHQMTELVEERHDVVVRHQPGVARLPAGQVADERRLGHLTAGDAGPDGELRRRG